MKRLTFSVCALILILNNLSGLPDQRANAEKLFLSNYVFAINSIETPISNIITNLPEEFLYLAGNNADLFILRNEKVFLSDKGVKYFSKNDRGLLNLQFINNDSIIFEKSFLLLKNNFINNGVIAHRGAWKNKNLPKNSIASLQNAINLGCKGSEFDVHLTADEVVVVNHDPEFNGKTIEKTNYADLRKLSLKNGESIPTFEEYLKTGMQQQKTRLVCELKESIIGKERSLLLAEKVLKKVQEFKAQAWMVYISFDYEILKHILEIAPASQTMYLGGNIAPKELKSDGIIGADYHYSLYQKDCEWIKKAHKEGIKVNAWTVNDPLVMDYLISQGIDYVTTDEPELLLEKWSKGTETRSLVWCDEFNYKGLPDSTKWDYQVGGHGWGNNELQYYTKADTQNVEVKNGRLFITARKQKMDKREYTSARLMTKNKGDWKYGKIEIRAKLPAGRGLWPAIWMLPTINNYGQWPASGEIDIMENVGYEPDTIHVTVHTKSFNHMIGTQVSQQVNLSGIYTDFHVYSIDWQEEKIDFFIDGVKHLTFNNTHKGFEEWPFDQPFFLLLNIAVGGNWGGKKGVDDSVFPATMEVDYVRVFK